jgi:hypothetical protein
MLPHTNLLLIAILLAVLRHIDKAFLQAHPGFFGGAKFITSFLTG